MRAIRIAVTANQYSWKRRMEQPNKRINVDVSISISISSLLALGKSL